MLTPHPTHRSEIRLASAWVALLAFILVLLTWVRIPASWALQIEYLPLHGALETLAIVVAAMVFAVSWATPRQNATRNQLWLGCAFLGVAILDFSHMLSYPGMPEFITPSSKDKALYFWLAARGMAAFALLAATALSWTVLATQVRASVTLFSVLIVTAGIHMLLLGHLDQLPPMFVEGQGLTSLKVSIEYGIILICLVVAALLVSHLKEPKQFEASDLIAAVLIMAMSEFLFTIYQEVTDLYNLAGHLYKVVAYGFLYRAMFLATIQAPYDRLQASEGQLKATLNALPDLLFELDQEGRYLEVHTPREEALLAPSDHLVGKTIAEVMPEDAVRTCFSAFEEAKCRGRSHGREILLAVPEGERWFELSVAPKPNQPGQSQRFVVISRDITERKANEALMHQLSMAVEQSPNPIVVTDTRTNIEYVNAAFTRISGYGADEVLGRNPKLLQSGKTPSNTYRDMWSRLNEGQSWEGEFINRRKNGEEYTERALIYPIRDADGRITQYLAHKEDITARKAATARIEHLSHYDQLTGLPNRALLEERFGYLQGLAQRSGKSMSLLWLDLDHFKDVNNTLGHAVGDMMLREVTHRLQNHIRHEDILSRQSGDEFVLVLAEAGHQATTRMIHRLQEMMENPVPLEGQDIMLTLSIGIAVYPSDGDSLDDLLRNAEAAMYRAKEEGRNSYRFFATEMQERSAHLLALGNAIKLGLGRGEFRLVYQPQFVLKDRRLVGAEALLRWQHPQWGAQSPGDFIPVAETLGLIVPLGDWVLRQAVQQIRAWQDQGFTPIKIAVNLSAAQFVQSGLPERIANLVHEEGISSEWLELELTETVALKDPESAVDTMKRLTDLGFSLSIDDFGTGYSSLSLLKKFAVYKLKIDRSFVTDVDHDADDRAIVTAIIQMAHSIGLKTIAEGVETAEQLAFLEAQGCDEVQGYFFRRPLEVKDFEEYLRGDSPA